MSEHEKKNAMQNDIAELSDKQLEKVDGGLAFSEKMRYICVLLRCSYSR